MKKNIKWNLDLLLKQRNMTFEVIYRFSSRAYELLRNNLLMLGVNIW